MGMVRCVNVQVLVGISAPTTTCVVAVVLILPGAAIFALLPTAFFYIATVVVALIQLGLH
jgi:hypothetical protein